MPSEQTYRGLFEEAIGAGVRASLQRVVAGGSALGEQDRQQAWHILSYALACHRDWPDTCALLLTLAPLMEQNGYREDWLPYLQCGLKRARQQGDDLAAGACQLHIGHLQQRQHQFQAAEASLLLAVETFRIIGAPQKQAAALNRLAELDRDLRRYDAGDRRTDEALTLLSNEDHEFARAHLTKGRIAFDLGELDRAQSYLATALRVFEEIDRPRGAAVSLQNLGRVAYLRGDYAVALENFRRAAALLEAVRDPFNLAVVNMNMGIVHSLRNEPEDALRAYARAEPDLHRLRELISLARLYNNQGIEYSNLQQWTRADALFRKSLDLWAHLENPHEYANTLHSLGESQQARGRHDEACEVYADAIAHLQPHAANDRDQKLLTLLRQCHQDAAAQAV